MSQKKRSFIAVHFSSQVISALDRIQNQLKQSIGSKIKIKWVKPNNIHLTLQFLGDVEISRLDEISQVLSSAFKDVQAFEVSLANIGAFPSSHRPRVIWMGIPQGADKLEILWTRVHQVTQKFGFTQEDRPFKPHVTLGRVKDPQKSPGLSESLEKHKAVSAQKCQIHQVHLMTSELRPTGPIYTNLDSFTLGE